VQAGLSESGTGGEPVPEATQQRFDVAQNAATVGSHGGLLFWRAIAVERTARLYVREIEVT
jgi:hypothetical protein